MLTYSSLNMNAGFWWIKYFVLCIAKLADRSIGLEGLKENNISLVKSYIERPVSRIVTQYHVDLAFWVVTGIAKT